jgi:hypothetical protein
MENIQDIVDAAVLWERYSHKPILMPRSCGKHPMCGKLLARTLAIAIIGILN